MDNNVYGRAELLESIQQLSAHDDMASPYSVPIKQMKLDLKQQNVSPVLESFYDTVATKITAPGDGIVYSVVNRGNAKEKLCSSMSDEEDLGSDPVYHILEMEEPQMYGKEDPGTDPVYHILEMEEPQMYVKEDPGTDPVYHILEMEEPQMCNTIN